MSWKHGVVETGVPSLAVDATGELVVVRRRVPGREVEDVPLSALLSSKTVACLVLATASLPVLAREGVRWPLRRFDPKSDRMLVEAQARHMGGGPGRPSALVALSEAPVPVRDDGAVAVERLARWVYVRALAVRVAAACLSLESGDERGGRELYDTLSRLMSDGAVRLCVTGDGLRLVAPGGAERIVLRAADHPGRRVSRCARCGSYFISTAGSNRKYCGDTCRVMYARELRAAGGAGTLAVT